MYKFFIAVITLHTSFYIKYGFSFNCYPHYCQNNINFTVENGVRCLLEPVRRDKECIDIRFDNLGHTPPVGDALAKVSLTAYVKDFGELKGKSTAFNFTVEDVNFDMLVTRYQNLVNEDSSACRRVKFYKNATDKPLEQFFISCPFSNSSFEFNPYRLEYLISSGSYEYSRKLVFIVPRHRFIDDSVNELTLYAPFIYVDVSDASFLTLHIQGMPQKFNVSTYKVWLFNNDTTKSSSIVLNIQNGQREIQHSFPVEDGIHYFKVAALHTQCGDFGCVNSTSPLINIKQISHRLLIMIISVVWIPPVILYGLYHLYKLYKRREILKRSELKPKCLLIYSPTHMSHVNVMIDLARYLRSCNINAMIDCLDITETLHKDPVIWCSDAFHNAEVIIVATSPETDEIAPVIYRNMDVQSLRLLKENYPLNDKRYYALQFPYCKKEDIPKEAKHFKRFIMPEDLNKLVKAIHEIDYSRYLDFGVDDKDFIDSIKLAQMQVQPVEKSAKSNKIVKEDLLLPDLKQNDITLQIIEDKDISNKNDESSFNNTKSQKYYKTNIEELNLLGECCETENVEFNPPASASGFRIDDLNL